MKQKTYIFIASIIFLIIGILHLLRIILSWEIIWEGKIIPEWVSWIGILIAGYFSYVGFIIYKKPADQKMEALANRETHI